MLTHFAHTLREPLCTPRLELEPMVQHHADAFFAPMQEEPLYEWISMERPPTWSGYVPVGGILTVGSHPMVMR